MHCRKAGYLTSWAVTLDFGDIIVAQEHAGVLPVRHRVILLVMGETSSHTIHCNRTAAIYRS